MDPIRVGVVGVGHLGTFHLQKYQKIPRSAIIGVADVIKERALEAARDFNCEVFPDHRDMIGRVDAVSIAVPTESHYSVARDFLAAGVDVLLEKPIATTLAEADSLIALAEEKKAVFQVGFVERFNPAVSALAEAIRAPLFIESHRLHPFFRRGTDVDVILDLMVHDLDIILNFVGDVPKEVDAVGVSVLSEKVDIANARITFAKGCVANVTASRITNKKMQKIRFFCPDSYHSVDYGKRELISLRREIDESGAVTIRQNDIAVKIYDPLEAEIRAFTECVAERTTPAVSGREARKSLELALQIVEKIKMNEEKLIDDTDG
ncbi:MAG: Gfo/Idh/MocA family oxidoreductase [Deltaproteobacteria bacterium]|nr:Gfo/Idh/MocA family oxidoreductase [Deltaproteobacteria bacterium]